MYIHSILHNNKTYLIELSEERVCYFTFLFLRYTYGMSAIFPCNIDSYSGMTSINQARVN